MSDNFLDSFPNTDDRPSDLFSDSLSLNTRRAASNNNTQIEGVENEPASPFTRARALVEDSSYIENSAVSASVTDDAYKIGAGVQSPPPMPELFSNQINNVPTQLYDLVSEISRTTLFEALKKVTIDGAPPQISNGAIDFPLNNNNKNTDLYVGGSFFNTPNYGVQGISVVDTTNTPTVTADGGDKIIQDLVSRLNTLEQLANQNNTEDGGLRNRTSGVVLDREPELVSRAKVIDTKDSDLVMENPLPNTVTGSVTTGQHLKDLSELNIPDSRDLKDLSELGKDNPRYSKDSAELDNPNPNPNVLEDPSKIANLKSGDLRNTPEPIEIKNDRSIDVYTEDSSKLSNSESVVLKKPPESLEIQNDGPIDANTRESFLAHINKMREQLTQISKRLSYELPEIELGEDGEVEGEEDVSESKDTESEEPEDPSELANPKSKALKDSSELANPKSRALKDSSETANPRSRPLEKNSTNESDKKSIDKNIEDAQKEGEQMEAKEVGGVFPVLMRRGNYSTPMVAFLMSSGVDDVKDKSEIFKALQGEGNGGSFSTNEYWYPDVYPAMPTDSNVYLLGVVGGSSPKLFWAKTDTCSL